MNVEMLTVGPIATNCYFIIDEDKKKLLVVDPGENGDKLAERIKDKGLTLSGILLTHGHYDHTDGVEDLRSAFTYDIPVFAYEDEKETLEEPGINLSMNRACPADVYLKEGDCNAIDGFSFKVIATPGHTKGGCCYYFEDEKILFSGDTLFCGSIGRTDFPGGSMEVLTKSIIEKLYTLPDSVNVFCGHDSPTTIGKEKTTNMYVRA